MTETLGFRLVQDPAVSDAQFWHLRAQHPDNPDVGKVLAAVNLHTYIGGFAKFYGAEHQIMAAAKFRRLYDMAQVGGSKACDMEREPVDGGGFNPDAVFEIGADARREFVLMQQHLGRKMFQRFEFVVVGGKGPTAYVRWITGIAKPNAKLVSRGKVEVRRIANNLAEYWGMASKSPIDRVA
ncbi:hypothetical protein [Pelagibacterium luteolum]|uniref:Uncharacterized protein n=1 Tax=Pelagibacterium luteolum TaxID=440168 RepID=A0A1G7ZI37_9HYPH|nr:hypothetical protein [Pelagibacterium luteolum]SDH08216.1 hypothetical protein SAMN04487974_12024 [Pelagibacterium luteolum]